LGSLGHQNNEARQPMAIAAQQGWQCCDSEEESPAEQFSSSLLLFRGPGLDAIFG
jgi:hypothetical protein